MNEETQVPTEIAVIIEQTKAAIAAERERKKQEQERQEQEIIQKGKALWKEYLETVLEKIPAWLRLYYKEDPNLDLKRIGQGWERPDSCSIFFEVPGLAPIAYRENQWKAPFATWETWEDSPPFLNWNSYWSYYLDETLIKAEDAYQRLEELKHQHAETMASQREQAQLRNKFDEEAEARAVQESAEKQAAEETEERKLFDVFKDDPVALNLLKAFLMINQERSTFEARLEDANETMYSIEERWNRRAADLRSQAEEADRRASEERDRASNLQYDLDDAESKLKKAQRGW